MIDLLHLEKYQENNRIEAKKALGGLPQSIWETYSAFANTLGGVILLGVEELADKSLRAINLPNPEKLVKDFWDTINNPGKASVNILTDRHVKIEEINGNKIIVIVVPRANRMDKPVYIEGNPLSGSYRRNGEGDYKCTKEEVQALLRDAATMSQDMKLISTMGIDVLDFGCVRRYRNRMQNRRPEHVWEELEDNEFLYKLGAVGRGDDGNLHPTLAGLLMFGFEYEIVREFPDYFLDYREETEENVRWTDRIVSTSGDWSGNIYDFYFRVYNKITQDIKVPFQVENGERKDDTAVHTAIREALANCFVNADYYGRQGLVILKRKNEIIIRNPGSFRLDIEAAKSGGVSDPRNTTIMKMFNLIGIGDRAGSGIPNIYYVWKKQGWSAPSISESFEPARIELSLPLAKSDGKKVTAKSDGKKVTAKTALQKQAIIEHLTKNVFATSQEIAELLDVGASRAKALLRELTSEGIVVAEGADKNRTYRLKR